jgi:hypothetical protein
MMRKYPHRRRRDNGADHRGREYWSSRLHRHGEIPGRYTKVITHRKERREAKAAILVDIEEIR